MVEHEGEGMVDADRHLLGPQVLAVPADREDGGPAGGGGAGVPAVVLDPHRHRDFLADDAVGRGLDDDEAAVALLLLACQHHVKGPG